MKRNHIVLGGGYVSQAADGLPNELLGSMGAKPEGKREDGSSCMLRNPSKPVSNMALAQRNCMYFNVLLR